MPDKGVVGGCSNVRNLQEEMSLGLVIRNEERDDSTLLDRSVLDGQSYLTILFVMTRSDRIKNRTYCRAQGHVSRGIT